MTFGLTIDKRKENKRWARKQDNTFNSFLLEPRRKVDKLKCNTERLRLKINLNISTLNLPDSFPLPVGMIRIVKNGNKSKSTPSIPRYRNEMQHRKTLKCLLQKPKGWQSIWIHPLWTARFISIFSWNDQNRKEW